MTGKEKLTLKGHSKPLTSLAFSPDGKTLASSSVDKTIKLWDVTTGEEKAIFRGTTSQDSLTAGTKRGLTYDGFDISKMKPTGVAKEDIDNAYQIITFDCELPDTFNARISERWNGIPPISEN